MRQLWASHRYLKGHASLYWGSSHAGYSDHKPQASEVGHACSHALITAVPSVGSLLACMCAAINSSSRPLCISICQTQTQLLRC